jgi:hypothetical protein
MKSGDRILLGVTIRQQTKDLFMSVTDLQEAYEKNKLSMGWTGQTTNQLMFTISLVEKCYGVLSESNLTKLSIQEFKQKVAETSLVHVLKDHAVYKTTGKGSNRNTMAHPYIWATIAMELNYMLHGKVVKWFTDELIFNRIEAGDKFKPMNAAICKLIGRHNKPDYPTYAREINIRVFGQHVYGARNSANSKQLKLISEIENTVTKAIEHEWIKTHDDLIKLIRTY